LTRPRDHIRPLACGGPDTVGNLQWQTITAAKAKDIGFRAQDGKLIIVESEAETVRFIFRRDAELGSVRLLKDELDARRQGAGF
jgi:hypothetical protein